MRLRSRHNRTLRRIFANPTPADIRWAEIEALLRAVGVRVTERSGSRVGLMKDSTGIVVHRPHPQPETSRHTVRDIKQFLLLIGVAP